MSEYQYFSHEILNEQERLIVLNAREHWSKRLIQTISIPLYAMKQAVFQNWSNCRFPFVRATTVMRRSKASSGCCHVTKA